MKLRSKHSDTIQQLKSQFLRDKREYQQDSENKITTLQRKANKVCHITELLKKRHDFKCKCKSGHESQHIRQGV